MSQPEQQWQDKLKLVKWDHSYPRKTYNLTTIHSLLVDPNPKFQQLKQIITNYNLQTNPDRIRYQQTYIEHLFNMLSQLVRLDTMEQQVQQLDKLHYWATKGGGSANLDHEFITGNAGGKSRPGTASTRTRPGTAYSRPQTGMSRPGTAKISTKGKPEKIEMKKEDPKIDYDKLKQGDQQFYAGIRTIHPELPHPKKRLKQYERVKLAEQNDPESDLQIIELQEKPALLKEIQVSEEKLMEEIQDGPQEGQEVPPEGAEGVEGQAEGDLNDPNIDDIPIQGEQEGAGVAQPEEQVEVIDKLRPKLKAYGEPANQKISKKHYQGGNNQIQHYKYYMERKMEEDKDIAQLEVMWAQGKSRAKSQMKRRAESARIVTKKIGVPMKKEVIGVQLENVVSFQNVAPVQVALKPTRPTTAFTSDRYKMREELIKNAFMNGKLSSHITKPQFAQDLSKRQRAMTAVGVKPKQKRFQDILKQAEQRVIFEAEDEVSGIKNSLAKIGVGMPANRIAKSITFEERELPGEWGGIVTGMGMIKNPFIKVAKKKKKKKKK